MAIRKLSMLALTGLMVCPVVARGQSTWSDDFEDGEIDPSLWEYGGARRGVGGFGSGDWDWSHEEVVADDGYLKIRVWGPTSPNTYGGEGWIRTKYDYNDGACHLINFTWEATIGVPGDDHINGYAIQITDGDTAAEDGSITWWIGDSACHKNLYCTVSNLGATPCLDEGQQNMPPTSGSVIIDAGTETASLYLGPEGTGDLHSQKTLDPNCSWYLRFFHMDATSAGLPAGDNLLNLYDFRSEPTSECPSIPTMPEWGIVAMALLVLTAGTVVFIRRQPARE